MLMAEEAITKGIVHFGDPIIDILRLGDKRAKALKKKAAPGSHCACFGPHHGTRCHQVGVGVNSTLWERYVVAQEAILERLRATMREYLCVLADDSERPAPAARALCAPPLGQDGNATDVAKKEGSHQRGQGRRTQGSNHSRTIPQPQRSRLARKDGPESELPCH
jgi:hypothetical protein